jgi:hypothetical protein
MIRNTGWAHLVGRMGGSMWGTGKRANSMDGVSTICLIRVRKWGSGSRVRESSGYRIISDHDRALNGMEKDLSDVSDNPVSCWCFIFIFLIIFHALINVQDMRIHKINTLFKYNNCL